MCLQHVHIHYQLGCHMDIAFVLCVIKIIWGSVEPVNQSEVLIDITVVYSEMSFG